MTKRSNGNSTSAVTNCLLPTTSTSTRTSPGLADRLRVMGLRRSAVGRTVGFEGHRKQGAVPREAVKVACL